MACRCKKQPTVDKNARHESERGQDGEKRSNHWHRQRDHQQDDRQHQAQQQRLDAGGLKADAILQSKNAQPATAAWAMLARSLFNLDETVNKN